MHNGQAKLDALLKTIHAVLVKHRGEAPERILKGLDEAVGEQGGFLDGSPVASMVLKISGLNWLRLQMDEFNYNWQKVVVNYGDTDQKTILNKIFGNFLPNTNRIIRVTIGVGSGFIVLFGTVFSFLWYKTYAGRYSRIEKIYMLWLYFISKFTGLKRKMGETPNNYLQRVKQSRYQRVAIVTEKITIKLEQDQYKL